MTTSQANGSRPSPYDGKVYPDYESHRQAFERATAAVNHTKVSNAALEARIDDTFATLSERVEACVWRYSWGNQSLYYCDLDGTPRFQADIARRLKVDRRRVSTTVKWLVARDRIKMVEPSKMLYPVIAPAPAQPSEIVNLSGMWRTYLQLMDVANSPDLAALKVARSEVKRLQNVLLSGFKKWRSSGTNPPASLLKESKESLKESPPPPQVSLEPEARTEEEEDRVSESTETPTQTPPSPDPYQELKASYPKGRFDEGKARPLFRALPRPEQLRALKALRERYLTCERWVDDGGKWIPWAHKWLVEKQYDADPPPKWSKQQQARGKSPTLDDVLALRRQRQGLT